MSRTLFSVCSINPYRFIRPVRCCSLIRPARLRVPRLGFVCRSLVPNSAHISTGFFSPWRFVWKPASPLPFFPARFVPIVTRKPADRGYTIARIPCSRSLLDFTPLLRRLFTAALRIWLASRLKPPRNACSLRLGVISANNCCKFLSSNAISRAMPGYSLTRSHIKVLYPRSVLGTIAHTV